MRAMAMCAVLLVSVSAAADPRRFDRRDEVVVDKREVDRTLDKIDRLLNQVEKRVDRDPQAKRALREVSDELRELRRMFVVRPPPPPPPPPAPRIHPIDPRSLGSLLDAVGRERFPDNQVRIVEQAAPANYFLVDHVRSVLERVRGEHPRLRAAVAFRGRIVDPQNTYVLLALFNSSADKQLLQRILAGEVNGPSAISTGELRNLVSALHSRAGSSQRQAYLAERAYDYWFTTAQARQVLDTFAGSADRMRALQVLRPRILDPQNEQPILTAFAASRDREQARQILR